MQIGSKLKKTLIAAAFLIVAAAVYFHISGRNRTRMYSKTFEAMGTVGVTAVYCSPAVSVRAGDFFETVEQTIREVEKICSRFDPGSELSRLNAAAAEKPFKCSDTLWQILMRARRGWEESDGLFDISSTPFMSLWGFYRRERKLPSGAEIEKAKQITGLEKIRFDDREHSVFFTVPGMSLDLGGIAKGCAVDMAMERLSGAGFDGIMINLGGNLRCTGKLPEKEAFRIGIRGISSPHIIGERLLRSGAAATSGDYERFVEINGRRYGHIMNPDTGMPAPGGKAVTVFTPLASDADVISTSVFIGGGRLAEKLVKKYPETEIWIYDDTHKTIYGGSNL